MVLQNDCKALVEGQEFRMIQHFEVELFDFESNRARSRGENEEVEETEEPSNTSEATD